MIDDSATDNRTARQATVPIIAVSFGYGGQPVAKLRPEPIVSNL